MDRHHLYWPRRDYTSALDRHFRNLPCLVVRISVEAHRMLHLHQKPPSKPSAAEMRNYMDFHNAGDCGCRP